MKLVTKILLSIVFLYVTSFSLMAKNKVVVIPMPGEVSKLANVITVSKEGGDFTDIAAALDSIPDPSGIDQSAQYLVLIGPGEYTTSKQLYVRPGVHLMGSGSVVNAVGKATTTIKATIDSNFTTARITGRRFPPIFPNSLIVADKYTKFSNFDLEVKGVSTRPAEAIIAFGFQPVSIDSMKISLSDANIGVGINQIDADIVVRDSLIQIFGDGEAYGIIHTSGLDYSTKLDSSSIEINNCSSRKCVGIKSEHDASVFLTNSTIKTLDQDSSSSVSVISYLERLIYPGTALFSDGGGSVRIYGSRLLGNVVLDNQNDDITVKILNSTLVNGVQGGNPLCLNSNNENEELLADCSIPE